MDVAFRADLDLHVDPDVARRGRAHRDVRGAASEVWYSLSRLRGPGLLQLGAVVNADDGHERLESALRAAIDEIRREGVSGDELLRAQARIRGSLLTSRDGPLAVAMQLNESIACGDWRAYATAADRIDAVAVADVARVAGRYLNDSGLTVAHLANADAGPEAQA